MPVGSSTGSMQVLDSRNPVLPDPGVVRVLDAVFLANLPHLWSDKGVPGRRHAGEQVMLDLKVRQPLMNPPYVQDVSTCALYQQTGSPFSRASLTGSRSAFTKLCDKEKRKASVQEEASPMSMVCPTAVQKSW